MRRFPGLGGSRSPPLYPNRTQNSISGSIMAPSGNMPPLMNPMEFMYDVDPHVDAMALGRAFSLQNSKCDMTVIYGVLCQRCLSQRQEIQLVYRKMYNADFVDDMRYKFKGRFKDLMLGLMQPSAKFDAIELRKAMRTIVVEILCTRTNAQIAKLKEVYMRLFGKCFTTVLKREPNDQIRHLLLALSMGKRDETDRTSESKATEDAEALYAAGEARWGNDDSVFCALLSINSFEQLRLLMNRYEKRAGHEFEKAIFNEFDGPARECYNTLVSIILDSDNYFAHELRLSMSSAGKDDSMIRIVVTRSERDLEAIIAEFNRRHWESRIEGPPLKNFAAWVSTYTPIPLRDAILCLQKGNRKRRRK